GKRLDLERRAGRRRSALRALRAVAIASKQAARSGLTRRGSNTDAIMPTRGAPGGPRLLLRRLREAMAEPVNAQARLDRIVVLIASNMVAEVCSVYVLRADQRLELFATE